MFRLVILVVSAFGWLSPWVTRKKLPPKSAVPETVTLHTRPASPEVVVRRSKRHRREKPAEQTEEEPMDRLTLDDELLCDLGYQGDTWDRTLT
jgi:hypothetical protein